MAKNGNNCADGDPVLERLTASGTTLRDRVLERATYHYRTALEADEKNTDSGNARLQGSALPETSKIFRLDSKLTTAVNTVRVAGGEIVRQVLGRDRLLVYVPEPPAINADGFLTRVWTRMVPFEVVAAANEPAIADLPGLREEEALTIREDSAVFGIDQPSPREAKGVVIPDYPEAEAEAVLDYKRRVNEAMARVIAALDGGYEPVPFNS